MATRGRAHSIGAERWGASREALGDAQVVVARASAALYPALPLLTAHLGHRAVTLPPARVAMLGVGEQVGRGAAPPPKPAPEPEDAAASDAGDADASVADTDPVGAPDSVVVLWQADLDPLSTLLASERVPPAHPT